MTGVLVTILQITVDLAKVYTVPTPILLTTAITDDSVDGIHGYMIMLKGRMKTILSAPHSLVLTLLIWSPLAQVDRLFYQDVICSLITCCASFI